MKTFREISQAVRKNGPFLLECQTYRCLGHSKSDQRKYRTKQEEQEWKEKCPIKFMQNFLLENEYVSPTELQDMAAKAEEVIEEAVKYAENSPYLDLEDAAKLVYA
jgi:TPP-dependent pyruvate/acetoin dehydrogenase alpha subunit